MFFAVEGLAVLPYSLKPVIPGFLLAADMRTACLILAFRVTDRFAELIQFKNWRRVKTGKFSKLIFAFLFLEKAFPSSSGIKS